MVVGERGMSVPSLTPAAFCPPGIHSTASNNQSFSDCEIWRVLSTHDVKNTEPEGFWSPSVTCQWHAAVEGTLPAQAHLQPGSSNSLNIGLIWMRLR